jgi:Divergent InlB B-repeat domain
VRSTGKRPPGTPVRPPIVAAGAAPLAAFALALLLAIPALAVPFHARSKALDLTGLNHACGVAIDSKGDLYASSAGESKVNIYNSSHTLLTSISDAHEPCGLAVTATGVLYVSEQATGEVASFKPNAYPFSGTPSYGSREVIDASGNAKGIAVDPFDNSLYVAEGTRVDMYNSAGTRGIDEVQRARVLGTGGSFELIFGGKETAPIKWDASHEEVQKALEALSSIGAGNVSVTQGLSVDAKDHRIAFGGVLSGADLEALTANTSELTGGNLQLETIVQGFNGHIGEGTLTAATGVAAYTHAIGEKIDRFLWVADPRGLLPDSLSLFSSRDVRTLKLRRELTGSTIPDGSFGFGAKGAYLAADLGNRNSEGKCILVGEQACTAGHLFLYDAAHKALDEFDASGEYLDQVRNAAFADAEPTGIAIDRSGASGDGTLYASAGAGSGAKVLAFGPLAPPGRKVLKKPSEEVGGLSQEFSSVNSVAIDSVGDLYAAGGSEIRIYDHSGKEIRTEANKPLLIDTHKPIDLAVDSAGNLYVLEENKGFGKEEEVTYYTPSKYPPDAATTYTRHATLVVWTDFSQALQSIAVNPGPGAGKDHLFVTSIDVTHEYDSAEKNSGLLNAKFAEGLSLGLRQSLAVNGENGTVWFGGNPRLLSAVDPAGKEILAQCENTGAANGKIGANPRVAVDQSDGHVIEFDATSSAREYDAACSFVAQFGGFTEGLVKSYRVAVDNGCAIHEPKLTGKACEEFDPANGTLYVAFDDTSPSHPPYDVNAFGPLKYTAEPGKHKLTVERKGTGSGIVKGGSAAEPSTIDCGITCEHEYLETEVVTLTATPSPKSKFAGWAGCEVETVSPTQGSCEVTMSEARKVTATFEPKEMGTKYSLMVKKTGAGTATSTPDGIDCGATCLAEFEEGTEVTLNASPDKGYEFAKWVGCDVQSSETECKVTMTEPSEVEVEFVVEHPPLTVRLEGNGSGEVTSDPSGIACPTTCSAKFNLNDVATLTASADPGSVFSGWTDCGAKSFEGECEVTMGEAKEITATFDLLPQAIARQAKPILYEEATLHGEIDSGGQTTEYRFEYLTEEEYEGNGETFQGAQQTPIGQIGPTKGPIAVEATLIGLDEGTEYRFRLRAVNSVGPAEDEGPPFETLQRSISPACPNAAYRFGLSTNLPDCRAYEVVTPAQTNGLSPEAVGSATSPSGGFSNWLTPQRGEGAGERLSYFTNGTLPGFEGNGILDGYRAERGASEHPTDGWQSVLFSPDYAESAPGVFHSAFQLGVSSDQLYSAWELNPEPKTFPETLPHGVYLRTPAGFEALGKGSLGTDLEALSLYVAGGGAHAIFSSTVHLEPGAPPAGNVALYDRAAGGSTAHVLTLPPNDASTEEETEFLDALRSKQQAAFAVAREDGAAVAFTAGVGLYVRLDDAKTERISPSTVKVGDTFDCAAGPLLGLAPGDQRRFKWLRDAMPIPGAEGGDIQGNTVYTAIAADKGTALQCLTVASSLNPRSVAVSAPVFIAPLKASQAPQPPSQIVASTPANPVVGTVETCDTGSWTGATSFAYQWYSDGEAISGATSPTYEVQAPDAPGTLQCVVSGTNSVATVAQASGLTPTSPAPAEPAPVATAQAGPKLAFASVSGDGRYAFFAFSAGESADHLLRFDTETEEATEIAATGIFAGTSSDGSHAFFRSPEALTGSEENENGEEAKASADNLYAWDGTTHFIARLAAADSKGGFVSTRSTPDGSAFVFQSHARLTAYDNEGMGEIYRYESEAGTGERLLCVSCDPSGGPPSADALLKDLRIGSGSPVKSKTIIKNLTENGKEVFFQSFDRLLPEDANEAEDVYEWTADESDGCSRLGGCLALISSGQGEGPSFLYAMSADGHDVFFHTNEKLVGPDVVGSPSIYDARVGGGIPEPLVSEPCQGDACQGQGSPPPALSTSATTGAGESSGSPPRTRHCVKGKHRVNGRCVARKHRHRHHRAHANRGTGR